MRAVYENNDFTITFAFAQDVGFITDIMQEC